MNILQITSDYPPNPLWGMGWHVHTLTNELKKLGHNVIVATSNRSKDFHSNIVSTSKTIDSQLLSSKNDEIFNNFDKFMQWNNELAKIVISNFRNKSFDIIHCHNWMSWKTSEILAKYFNTKTIVSAHFLQKQYDFMDNVSTLEFHDRVLCIENQLMNDSDSIIVFSNEQLNFLKKYYKVNLKKVDVIPQGTNISPYKFEFLKKQRLRNKQINIVYAGRLSKDKGLLELVNVTKKLYKKYNNIKLNIAGDGELTDFIRKNKLPFINLIGYLNKEDLAVLLEHSDIFCLPSSSESFGLSVVEAMQYGLPIVFSSGNYIPKLFINYESGIYVPLVKMNGKYHTDSNELEKSLDLLIRDPDTRYFIGEGALDIARNKYTISVMVNNIIKLYTKIYAQQ